QNESLQSCCLYSIGQNTLPTSASSSAAAPSSSPSRPSRLLAMNYAKPTSSSTRRSICTAAASAPFLLNVCASNTSYPSLPAPGDLQQSPSTAALTRMSVSVGAVG
ncbi:unnamed protein product, partial [Amoebophrya sp. A120]